MNTTSTRLRNLADRMGLDGFAEELREIALELEAPSEPFGYFRAEPMGWTDCAATDEGAIALYERPAGPAVPQGVIYEKADSLYKRGYTDRQTGKDYDPRGCDEWQEVVDWLTPAAPSQPAVPQGEPVVGYRISHPSEPDLGTWLAEEAPNDPTDLLVEPLVLAAPSQPVNRPQNCGTSFCSCIECVCEPELVTLTDDWADCKRISEIPAVDEALRLFAEGETTEDQAVAIVQAIIAALREKEQTK